MYDIMEYKLATWGHKLQLQSDAYFHLVAQQFEDIGTYLRNKHS